MDSYVRALVNVAWWITRHKHMRRYYWRNTLLTALMGAKKFDFAQSTMLMFTHLGPQSIHVRNELDGNIDYALHQASYPRQPGPQQTGPQLPVVSVEHV